jgi:hypothetical protein
MGGEKEVKRTRKRETVNDPIIDVCLGGYASTVQRTTDPVSVERRSQSRYNSEGMGLGGGREGH